MAEDRDRLVMPARGPTVGRGGAVVFVSFWSLGVSCSRTLWLSFVSQSFLTVTLEAPRSFVDAPIPTTKA